MSKYRALPAAVTYREAKAQARKTFDDKIAMARRVSLEAGIKAIQEGQARATMMSDITKVFQKAKAQAKKEYEDAQAQAWKTYREAAETRKVSI